MGIRKLVIPGGNTSEVLNGSLGIAEKGELKALPIRSQRRTNREEEVLL